MLLGKKQIDFCYQCQDFPGANLKQFDQRHRRDTRLGASDNLLRIKRIGSARWLAEPADERQCPSCGGNIWIIDKESYE